MRFQDSNFVDFFATLSLLWLYLFEVNTSVLLFVINKCYVYSNHKCQTISHGSKPSKLGAT